MRGFLNANTLRIKPCYPPKFKHYCVTSEKNLTKKGIYSYNGRVINLYFKKVSMKKIILLNPIQANNLNMTEEDVFKIKEVLNDVGYYKSPEYGITPYPDQRMFDAIKNFQRDNNLKVDGVINPKGETLEHLNRFSAKSPMIRCTNCGGPHGGSQGDMCPDCTGKVQ
jgi:hypothetical protein